MAPKGGKGRVRAEESDDETMSTISFGDTMSMYSVDAEEVVYDKSFSELEGFLDALYEKRGSTREAGLRGLIAGLACKMELMLEFVPGKYETLVNRLGNCLKKGGAWSDEVDLACRALGLLALTVAMEGELGLKLLVEECFPPLLKLAKGYYPPAVECLGLVAFIGSYTGDVDVEASALGSVAVGEGGVIGMVWEIATKRKGTVQAAAVAAWSLMFTTLPPHRVVHYVKLGLPFLCDELVYATYLSVLKVVGEAVGLLFEAAVLREDVAGGGSSMEAVYGKDFCAVMEQKKAVLVRVNDKDSKKRTTNIERVIKVNAGSFHSFMASIEDGCECQETVVKFKHGDVLRINTWLQTVQLNYLRKHLAEGFQKHMEENSFLQHIFDYVPRESGREDKMERKMRMSSVSKARTKLMNRRRSEKDEYLAGC